MRLQLTIATQFTQGADDDGQLLTFTPGVDRATKAPKAVPDDVWQGWGPETLANRLGNGFVKWEAVRDTDDASTSADPLTLDRDQLAQYIADTFDFAVDKRISLVNMQQQLATLIERKRLQDLADLQDAANKTAGGGTTDPTT